MKIQFDTTLERDSDRLIMEEFISEDVPAPHTACTQVAEATIFIRISSFEKLLIVGVQYFIYSTSFH